MNEKPEACAVNGAACIQRVFYIAHHLHFGIVIVIGSLLREQIIYPVLAF